MNAYTRGAKLPPLGTVIAAEPPVVRDQGTVVAPSLSTSLSSSASSLVPGVGGGGGGNGSRDAFHTNMTSLGTPEYMISITASQKFEGHSFEVCTCLFILFLLKLLCIELVLQELRVAFLQYGRELTTSEVISAKAQAYVQQQAVPQPPGMGSPVPSGGMFGLSAATAVKPFSGG
jgi:hypothetical protein